MLHLTLLLVLTAKPLDFADFQARVATQIAAQRDLPDLRAVRAPLLYLKPSSYMGGPRPSPSAHELGQWFAGRDGLQGGLLLAQEVATGWQRLKPSEASEFPPGTPPETVAKMQEAERMAILEVALAALSRSGHPLAPEAIWHLMWAKDTPLRIRDLGLNALAAGNEPTAIDVLLPCIDAPPEKDYRLKCVAALGRLHTKPALDKLLELLKVPRDPDLRAAVIKGLAAAAWTAPNGDPPGDNLVRQLAFDTLKARMLEPKLGAEEPAVIAAFAHMPRSWLQAWFGPELDKPHPPEVIERLKRAIASGGDDPSRTPHPKL